MTESLFLESVFALILTCSDEFSLHLRKRELVSKMNLVGFHFHPTPHYIPLAFLCIRTNTYFLVLVYFQQYGFMETST